MKKIKPKTSKLAITSFILGIISLIFILFIFWYTLYLDGFPTPILKLGITITILWPIITILNFIFAIKLLKRLKNKSLVEKKVYAITGVILGILMMVVLIILLFMLLYMFFNARMCCGVWEIESCEDRNGQCMEEAECKENNYKIYSGTDCEERYKRGDPDVGGPTCCMDIGLYER